MRELLPPPPPRLRKQYESNHHICPSPLPHWLSTATRLHQSCTLSSWCSSIEAPAVTAIKSATVTAPATIVAAPATIVAAPCRNKPSQTK